MKFLIWSLVSMVFLGCGEIPQKIGPFDNISYEEQEKDYLVCPSLESEPNVSLKIFHESENRPSFSIKPIVQISEISLEIPLCIEGENFKVFCRNLSHGTYTLNILNESGNTLIADSFEIGLSEDFDPECFISGKIYLEYQIN